LIYHLSASCHSDADENEDFDDDELFGDDAFDDDDDEGFEELTKAQQAKAQQRKVNFGDACSDEAEDDDDQDWDDDEQEGRAKPGRALTKSERKAEQALQDALDEYSDEEIGDLEDDPDARGQVEDVMEEFSDFIDKCLEPKKHDYDGPDLLVRPEISQAEAAEMTRKAIENLAMNDRDDPAAEAASMAAFEASLARQPEPEFDCQSIVSTYSNLENRPRVIAVPKAGKIIKLHPVTGVPMGVAVKRQTTIVEEDESDSDDSSYDDTTSVVTVNKGQSRSKKETKEEKAARKAAAKDAKRQNRQRKKVCLFVFAIRFSSCFTNVSFPLVFI
jgi:protein LTV1